MTQWFLKITDYAQELLDCPPKLDWPEKTKASDKLDWKIGGFSGSAFVEKNGEQLKNEDGTPVKLEVFTTRVDTFMGITYVVVAPESELYDKLTTDSQRSAVDEYKKLP